MQNLSDSSLDRENILNNNPALRHVEQYFGFQSPVIEGQMRFTLKQIAEYFEVEPRTIERYIEKYGNELEQSWYEVRTGERLSEAKRAYLGDINVGQLDARTPSIGFFTFRSFLNIGMLLTESEKAKELRTAILNIVMGYITQKWGGTTKYINQNDIDFVQIYRDNLYYRKQFTDALYKYVQGGPNKYPYFTNLVYEAIFWERAHQYKALLKLWKKENERHTFYSEVLSLVSAFEAWFGAELAKNWPLSFFAAKELFDEFKKSPIIEPLLRPARSKMATRDRALRDVFHEVMEPYMKTLPSEEYELFCHENADLINQLSQNIITVMDDNKDVLMRLKDK